VFDTLVIGGGQTGLTVGHHLSRTGRTFLILDANQQPGDAWRNRWDSLVLFTPVGFSGLPGMDFPGKADHFPTKDEMADFLDRYAREMALPVLSGTRVERLAREGDLFVAQTADETFRARNAVVAMADHQIPNVPTFADELDPRINQLHSSQYQNLGSLQEGPTLVVGLGNSGADIGLEIARDRKTYVSGTETGVIPFRIGSWFGRNLGVHIVRFVATRVLTDSTPIGKRVRRKMGTKGQPLVRVRPADLVADGAERVPRVTGVSDGVPELADGRTLAVDNVVWCTGFRPGFDWIDLPVFAEDGLPRHERGVVEEMPGLYFCGLFFQHSLWSETLAGMPADVRYVVDHLDRRPTPADTFTQVRQ
ncbi:MAG: NAD(P)-binding domain-containing protein, partial [Acidimicrobiia bacterium]